MARHEDEECPICASDQCPQCGDDRRPKTHALSQLTADLQRYIGKYARALGEIESAIGAIGARPLADTVADVRRLVADRDDALAEVASLRQELWRERTVAANQKLDRDIMAQAIVAGAYNRDRRR